MKTMVDNEKIARMEKNIYDLQTGGGGGGSEQGNFINYHVEIKAGGPVTINSAIEDDGLVLGSYSGSSKNNTNLFGFVNDVPIKEVELYNKNLVHFPAFPSRLAAIDTFDNNKIITLGSAVYCDSSNSNQNVYLSFGYSIKASISNYDNLELGDYTLEYTYAFCNNSIGYNYTLKITSPKNVGKIHMVVFNNNGKKSIKFADGETGLVYTYLSQTGDVVLGLIDCKLIKGWTE